MLMSKSQALEVATLLRKAAKSNADGFVRTGYVPRRGIVVEVVKNDRVLVDVGETGAPLLRDLDEDLLA